MLPILNLFFAMKTNWIDQGNLFRGFYKMMKGMKREIMLIMDRQGWVVNICKFGNDKKENHRIIES